MNSLGLVRSRCREAQGDRSRCRLLVREGGSRREGDPGWYGERGVGLVTRRGREFLAPEGCAWGSREEVVDYPALDAPGSKRRVEGSRGLSEEMCEFFKGRGVR